VVLTVTQTPNGCIGTAGKTMTIYPNPTVSITLRDTCANQLFPLVGHAPANAVSYTWTPPLGITDTSALVTTATASSSTTYSLAVTDVNGCRGSSTASLYIQQPPKNIKWDTTVIVGQTVPISASAGNNMSYTWTPTTDLSCQYCTNPISTSTTDITYSVTVKDNMGCFSTVNTYSIHIDPRATVDVPTAFTPNGDGTNDVIYVDGWGIKKLNYFRIYNRWGQLLFESNDIKTGWDGMYNGVPQNMETYVYQVSAETYVDKDPQLKTGSFKLIR
jgi:gliding motility-associated-like protein